MTQQQMVVFMREAVHAQALIEDRMTQKQREKLEREVFLLENPYPNPPTRCSRCGHTVASWTWPDRRKVWWCFEPTCGNTWEYRPK